MDYYPLCLYEAGSSLRRPSVDEAQAAGPLNLPPLVMLSIILAAKADSSSSQDLT